jgi:hypothetical protein
MKHTAQPEPVQHGRVYLYEGHAYRVGLLNECRARLDPVFRVQRTITNRLTARLPSFMPRRRA